MKSMLSLLLPLLVATHAAAHGYLAQMTINGQVFPGNLAGGDTISSSTIRRVSTGDPNKGASNPALTCGPNATAGALVANANPGDAITFTWKGEDGIANWPHNTGPLLTYLASCGSTTCDKFDASQAQWFKIAQDGKTPGDNSTWVQSILMTGAPGNVTLPATLAAGNYLIRFEIIALHLATSEGGAEFYPACAQLAVGGSQTGVPTSDELVSIPGAYSDTDPGIFDPNVFTPDAPYTFPGPPIAAFVGAASTGGSSGTTTATGASSTATGAPAQPSSSSGKTCTIKKRAPAANDVVVRPRHLSRIMRRLAFGQSSTHF